MIFEIRCDGVCEASRRSAANKLERNFGGSAAYRSSALWLLFRGRGPLSPTENNVSIVRDPQNTCLPVLVSVNKGVCCSVQEVCN